MNQNPRQRRGVLSGGAQRTSPQSEVEVVDGAEPEPLVEEVKEDDPEISGDEVSSNPSLKWDALTQY